MTSHSLIGYIARWKLDGSNERTCSPDVLNRDMTIRLSNLSRCPTALAMINSSREEILFFYNEKQEDISTNCRSSRRMASVRWGKTRRRRMCKQSDFSFFSRWQISIVRDQWRAIFPLSSAKDNYRSSPTDYQRKDHPAGSMSHRLSWKNPMLDINLLLCSGFISFSIKYSSCFFFTSISSLAS